MKHLSFFIVLAFLGLAACSPSASQLKKTLEENPEIVFNAIEKNPKAFFESVKKAEEGFREEMEKGRAEAEEKALEEDFKNPKQPVVDASRAIFGNKNAPITIVEYSDFQCPFCARAHNTMEELFKKYPDKIRLVYKHLPFKPQAEPAARYFEAIAMQDGAKAKKFHDTLYENQRNIMEGTSYLDKVAKQVGADLAKVKKSLNSEEISKRLAADLEEARKFNFEGTPGFLVNGVSVRGAFPLEHFAMIIDRHLNDNKKN